MNISDHRRFFKASERGKEKQDFAGKPVKCVQK